MSIKRNHLYPQLYNFIMLLIVLSQVYQVKNAMTFVQEIAVMHEKMQLDYFDLLRDHRRCLLRQSCCLSILLAQQHCIKELQAGHNIDKDLAHIAGLSDSLTHIR